MSEPAKLGATYFDGELRVSMWDLLTHLDTEGKRDLAQRLACDDDVLAAVTDQLISGYTENASWGAKESIDAQRRKVVDAVGTEILRQVVREALRQVEYARADAKRAVQEKDALARLIHDFTRDCDKELGCRAIANKVWKCRAEWNPATVTDAEVTAYIDRVALEIEAAKAKAKEGGAS